MSFLSVRQFPSPTYLEPCLQDGSREAWVRLRAQPQSELRVDLNIGLAESVVQI